MQNDIKDFFQKQATYKSHIPLTQMTITFTADQFRK